MMWTLTCSPCFFRRGPWKLVESGRERWGTAHPLAYQLERKTESPDPTTIHCTTACAARLRGSETEIWSRRRKSWIYGMNWSRLELQWLDLKHKERNMMRPFLATRDKSNTDKPAQIKPRFFQWKSHNVLKGTTVLTFYDCLVLNFQASRAL